MNKKWSLILLFSFSNNMICAEAELNNNISSLVKNESVDADNESVSVIEEVSLSPNGLIEEKSLSLWQRAKRTIKSDLCIGDDIIEHNSFSQQVLASLRLTSYSMLTVIPLFCRHLLFHSGKGNSNIYIAKKELMAVALLVLVWAPLAEVAIFTYFPQYIGKKTIKNSRIRSCFNLLPTVIFGLAHYPNCNSYVHVVHAGFINHLNQRYLLKRNSNKVPIFHHALSNAIPMIFLYNSL